MFNPHMGYRNQQAHSPSPQPLSPNNIYQNQSNAPSPYYDRISPDIGNVYTPPPQSQQFLQPTMSYHFQTNNLNSLLSSTSNQNTDWLNPDMTYNNLFNNLNPVNTHQQQPMQQQQQQSQTQNITDSNLNIIGENEALTTSGLMEIDSAQLLNIDSREISNLSIT